MNEKVKSSVSPLDEIGINILNNALIYFLYNMEFSLSKYLTESYSNNILINALEKNPYGWPFRSGIKSRVEKAMNYESKRDPKSLRYGTEELAEFYKKYIDNYVKSEGHTYSQFKVDDVLLVTVKKNIKEYNTKAEKLEEEYQKIFRKDANTHRIDSDFIKYGSELHSFSDNEILKLNASEVEELGSRLLNIFVSLPILWIKGDSDTYPIKTKDGKRDLVLEPNAIVGISCRKTFHYFIFLEKIYYQKAIMDGKPHLFWPEKTEIFTVDEESVEIMRQIPEYLYQPNYYHIWPPDAKCSFDANNKIRTKYQWGNNKSDYILIWTTPVIVKTVKEYLSTPKNKRINKTALTNQLMNINSQYLDKTTKVARRKADSFLNIQKESPWVWRSPDGINPYSILSDEPNNTYLTVQKNIYNYIASIYKLLNLKNALSYEEIIKQVNNQMKLVNECTKFLGDNLLKFKIAEAEQTIVTFNNYINSINHKCNSIYNCLSQIDSKMSEPCALIIEDIAEYTKKHQSEIIHVLREAGLREYEWAAKGEQIGLFIEKEMKKNSNKNIIDGIRRSVLTMNKEGWGRDLEDTFNDALKYYQDVNAKIYSMREDIDYLIDCKEELSRMLTDTNKEEIIKESVNLNNKIYVILSGSPAKFGFNTKEEWLEAHPWYEQTTDWSKCQIVFTNDINSETTKLELARRKNIPIKEYE